MRQDTEYPVVCVECVDGKTIWGLLVNEKDKYIVLARPLNQNDHQSITIPWHRIDSIYSEDEEDAPWNPRGQTSTTSKL